MSCAGVVNVRIGKYASGWTIKVEYLSPEDSKEQRQSQEECERKRERETTTTTNEQRQCVTILTQSQLIIINIDVLMNLHSCLFDHSEPKTPDYIKMNKKMREDQ